MLLTISAISSKKEIYLDKISSLGEEYLTLYLNLIEKYIIIDGDNYSSESSKLYPQTKTHLDKENKYIEQQLYIEGLETEIIRLNSICVKLKENNTELENKYKDLIKDFENINSLQSDIKTKNQYFEESISFINIKNILAIKEEEIERLVAENNKVLKAQIDENESIREINRGLSKKIEILESSLNELNALKGKYQDYEDLKEKQKNYECLLIELEVKDNQMKKNFNDKKQYEIKVDKLYKELLSERDKTRHLEFEKKKLEFDIQILNSTVTKLEDQSLKKRIVSPQNNDNNNEHLCSLNLIVEENTEDLNVDKLELLRICHEQSEKLNNLFSENDEIVKNYEKEKDILMNLLKDRDELFEENTNLLNECKDLRELLKSKGETVIVLEERVISEGEKYRFIMNEKLLLIKEIETLKKQIGNQVNFINNMEKEKKELNDMNKSLQLELEIFRLNSNFYKKNLSVSAETIDSLAYEKVTFKQASFNNYDYPKEISKLRNDLISIKKECYDIQNTKNDEIQSLKNEVLSLNISIKSKENENKTISETLRNVKDEYTSLYNSLQNLNENYNFELVKVKEEMDGYKNSLETMRGAINSEHEMISYSLREVFALMTYLKENVIE